MNNYNDTNMKREIKVIVEQFDNGITWQAREEGEDDVSKVILDVSTTKEIGMEIWNRVKDSMDMDCTNMAEMTITIETEGNDDD